MQDVEPLVAKLEKAKTVVYLSNNSTLNDSIVPKQQHNSRFVLDYCEGNLLQPLLLSQGGLRPALCRPAGPVSQATATQSPLLLPQGNLNPTL